MNLTAVSLFILFVSVTLYATWRAARRSKSASEFYAAGNSIGGFTNGLAISGDFMSAATFLGIVGLVYASGFDVYFYILGPMLGLCILMFSMAEPFRNLGRFTLSDVAAYRLKESPTRIYAASTSLVIVILYLVAQFVGAGKLMQLLFGLSYAQGVVTAGVLTMVYVSFGGMLATTWVQLIKAVLMITAITYMGLYVLGQFSFNPAVLYSKVAEVHEHGAAVFGPGLLLKDPISMVSLAITMPLGFVGLPHILMRLFTVPDARQAKISVFWGTSFIGIVMLFVFFVIPYGAVVLLPQYPEFYTEAGKLIGGNNMVSIHLSKVIGGDVFYGVICAVAFATILAVVCGLVLAGASAVSHDLYARGFCKGKVDEVKEVLATRVATVVITCLGILLAFYFEQQNIAYMAAMVFAVSASANFPVLILSIYWRNLTTRGAIVGGSIGLVCAVVLMILGPTVWVEILDNDSAIFPYKYPGIFSIPLAFICIWLISITDKSEQAVVERAAFDAQYNKAFGF